MRLAELIADPDADLTDIATILDDLDGVVRWAQLSRLDRTQQRMLYRKASASAVDLAYFVGDAPARTEVIHDGLNTLPIPPRLRRFQKRFCRPDNPAAACLFGYNEGPTRRLLGPGYFVASLTDAHPTWPEHGGVVVDYFQVPDAAVAHGWPPVVPNTKGLQRFVFYGTRDFVRGVSAHVSVGAAFKHDRPLDHYFVLCRRP
jgi:hypothetical protein